MKMTHLRCQRTSLLSEVNRFVSAVRVARRPSLRVFR